MSATGYIEISGLRHPDTAVPADPELPGAGKLHPPGRNQVRSGGTCRATIPAGSPVGSRPIGRGTEAKCRAPTPAAYSVIREGREVARRNGSTVALVLARIVRSAPTLLSRAACIKPNDSSAAP